LTVLFIMSCNFLYADDNSFISNLIILDENDLSQVKNHELIFMWESDGEIQTFELFTIIDNKDSLIWLLEPESLTENQYRLVTPHLLVDGGYYKFQVTSRNDKLAYVYFVMNSKPQVVKIENQQNQIITSDSLIINISDAFDKEILLDSLKYQIKIIDQENITEAVMDTFLTAIDSGRLFIDGKVLQENHKFTLHIKTFDGVEFSEWSDGFSFFMNRVSEPPTAFKLKSSKEPQIFTKEPILKWTKSIDPEQLLGGKILNYSVEISPYEDFMMITEKQVLKERSFQPEKSENHRKYFWKVTAMDSDSLTTISDEIGVFYVDHGNVKPPKAIIIHPENHKTLKPTNFISWKQPKDKDRWDVLTYKLILSENGNNLSSFYLSETRIDSLKSGLLDNISISYDNRILVPLSYLLKSTTIIEGNEYQINIETFDNWQGKNKTNLSTFIFDDNINQKPNSPKLGFQPDSTIISTTNPILMWDKATDSDVNDQLKYEVILSLDPGFFTARRIQQESGYGEHSIQIQTALMENKQYFWKVRSVDLMDAKSEWSELNTFWVNSINEPPVGPVELLYPKNYSEFNSESIFWWKVATDPDPGDRVKYLLEIAADNQFENKQYSYLIPVANSNLKWPEGNKPEDALGLFINEHSEVFKLIDNRMYFWRIIAQDNQDLKSINQYPYPRIAFNEKNDPPDIPGDFSPANGKIISTAKPRIKWQHSVDPDFADLTTTLHYQLRISKDIEFQVNDTKLVTTDVGENSFSINEELTENVKYYYQINAFDSHGGSSGWSLADSFFVNAKQEPPTEVVEMLPRNSVQIKSDSPILSWKPSFDPDPDFSSQQISYKIKYIQDRWLHTNKEKKNTKYITTQKGDISAKLNNLAENQRYSFWIQAIDQHGKTSNWSQQSQFSVNMKNDSPGGFQLLYPFNNADSVITDLEFIWKSSFDPDPDDIITYNLYFSEDSSFSTDFEMITLYPTENDSMFHNPMISLKRATKYFWKVSAEDNHGIIVWGSNVNDNPFVFTTVGYKKNRSLGMERYVLYDNKPNPFYSKTTIEYDVKEHGIVKIAIFNVLGEKVKNLVSKTHNSGRYSLEWDGTDDSGNQVPGGMYLCRMTSKGFMKNRKMLLLR